MQVTITFFLPGELSTGTCHTGSGQTNYIANGNVSNADIINSTHTTTSYCFLTKLDVTNASAEGAVVAFGASITDHLKSTLNANRR